MKTVFLALALIIGARSLPAQATFRNAVGLRLGYPISATFKHFLDDASAVEAFVGLRGYGFYNSFALGAAYQRHYSFEISDPDLAPLNWYWGAGASLRFWNYDRGDRRFLDDDYARTSLGLSGYLGLQYAFTGAPIELTLDWVPTVHVGNVFRGAFGADHGGLAVRYILR